MLHFRIRALPRRQTAHPPSSAPPPTFNDPSQKENEEDDDEEEEEDPEDLFTSFLPHLFPDDAPPFHGNPGQHLLYSSPRYGDLTIMVPSYPGQHEDRSKEIAAGQPDPNGGVNKVEEGRKLFAHLLWTAAMVVADGIEKDDGDSSSGMWKVEGERVLELGAGAGLPSIIAALAHASAVTVTDHPSSPALDPSGAIAFNTKHNLSPAATCTVDIRPHEWGVLSSDPWAVSTKGMYTRIIAADCYWMPSQHENLVRTMKWFLATEGRVWVVAGFHTGRPIIAGFFETATRMGLEIEEIYERDSISVTEEGGEIRREWASEREGEGPENRRRWCVIALLKHASSASV